ncbi:MAG: PDZ domain-containing protein, partial [Thermoanaerobaculia bacterium]
MTREPAETLLPTTAPILRRGLIYVLPLLLLGGLFGLKVVHSDAASGRRVGFSLNDGATGVSLRALVPDLPADAAGLREGDRLLEIAGHPIRVESDYDGIALLFQRGEPVSVIVDRAGQRLTFAMTPGVPVSWGSLVLDLVVAIAYLALGMLAIGQAGLDVRARLLYFYSLAVAAELSLPSEPVNALAIGLWSTAAFYLLSGMQMGAEIHLSALVPERPNWLKRRPWLVSVFYSIGGIVAASTAIALIVETLGGRLPWTSSQAEFVLLDLGLPVWAATQVLILGERFLHHPRRAGRQQAGLVLLGLLPWMCVVFFLAGRQLLGLPVVAVPQALWTLVLLGFPVAVFVAIFRYQLFDIELVIRRSLLYGAL